MHFRQFILVVITGLFVLLNFSCAGKLNSSAESEVVFDDGYQTQAKKNEVTIDDSSFAQTSELSTKPEERQETPTELKDESVVSVMYDAFGNKIETREFPKDPRLLLLTITTSANGKQEIIVRGRNGERKNLAPETLDNVLTANADEIAHTTGIFATQRTTQLPSVVLTQQEEQLLPPKQTYQTNTINQQIPQLLTEQPVQKEDKTIKMPESSTDQKSDADTLKSSQTNLTPKNSDESPQPSEKKLRNQSN